MQRRRRLQAFNEQATNEQMQDYLGTLDGSYVYDYEEMKCYKTSDVMGDTNTGESWDLFFLNTNQFSDLPAAKCVNSNSSFDAGMHLFEYIPNMHLYLEENNIDVAINIVLGICYLKNGEFAVIQSN